MRSCYWGLIIAKYRKLREFFKDIANRYSNIVDIANTLNFYTFPLSNLRIFKPVLLILAKIPSSNPVPFK